MSVPVFTREYLVALQAALDDLRKSPAPDVEAPCHTVTFDTPIPPSYVEPAGAALNILFDDEGRAYTIPTGVFDEVVKIKKERMLPRSLLSIARLYFGHTVQRYYPHGKAVEESADSILDILGHHDINARRRVVEILKILSEASAPF